MTSKWIEEIRKYLKNDECDEYIIKFSLSYTLQSLRANEDIFNKFKWEQDVDNRFYIDECEIIDSLNYFENIRSEGKSETMYLCNLLNGLWTAQKVWQDMYFELEAKMNKSVSNKQIITQDYINYVLDTRR